MAITNDAAEHAMHVQRRWFEAILSGKKNREGRKGTSAFKNIKVGDLIRFYSDHKDGDTTYVCDVVVTDVVFYAPSDDVLRSFIEGEDLSRLLPGITDIDEAMGVYLDWSSETEINKYGMLSIRFDLLD